MKQIDPTALGPFDPRHWTLIPLHRPNDTKTTKKGLIVKTGKAPLDAGWPTKRYNHKEVIARAVKQNRNTGVALRSNQLVIDVDPRNGGDKSFRNLCADFRIDPSQFPRVITGSGGDHYYMTKPADFPVLDTVEGYEGVEFKSKGRQMVAPGSIHPETGEHYVWAEDHPPLAELPEVPRRLLKIIQRPQRSATHGGGQYTQEQIAKALDQLDPCKFAEHDDWFRLMCACHHASNGDARSEFVDWSITDPTYSDHGEVVGRRWDSLHKDKDHGITYATLNKILADAGKANAQAPGDAKGDFAGLEDDDGEDDWLEAGDEAFDDGVPSEENEELRDHLDKLNMKYTLVVDGGKLRILYKQPNKVLKRSAWVRMTPQDFQLKYSNIKLENSKKGKGNPQTIGLGKAWMEWPNRNTRENVLFDPSGAEHPEALNMWDGFDVPPSSKGEWTYLRELIFEVLSNGDEAVDAYIINWLAYMFQFPDERAQVAMVFRGGRGVGKGTLGNCVAHIIGRHAMAIQSAELLTGRFNEHLQDLIFLFADEAVKPYDKAGESRLKGLITEPVLSYEGKGRDIVTAKNYIHIMMASNERWVIPAGIDERRYLVSDANTKWQGKRREKFLPLLKQMDAGGYKRMLFDLQRHPIPEGWTPADVPATAALTDQKVNSLTPLAQFIFGACDSTNFPIPVKRGPWEEKPIRVFVEDLRDEFHSWCRSSGINPGGMGRGNMRFLLQELTQMFPNARTELREHVGEDDTVRASPSDGRAQAIELPSLKECRAAFEQQLGAIWSKTDFG